MQKNVDENKSHNPKEDANAIRVLASFARSLRMEPRYLQYFGEKDLQLAEYIIQFVEKHSRIRLNFYSIIRAIVFCFPDSIQRWFLSTFVRKGFDTIIISRKIMIDAKMKIAIENEHFKQVIFLGAGYDLRAFIGASNYKAVNFYEMDRGFNRDQKIKALQGLPDINADVLHKRDNTYVFNQNLTCIECDFKKDNLAELLSRNGFDPSLKTLVVAEGLSFYLPKSAMDALMQSLYGLLTENSEIVISFVGIKKMSAKRSAKLRARITVNGEMAYFALKTYEVINYVRYFGFELKDKFTTASSMTLEKNYKIRKYYTDPTRRGTAYYTLVKSSTMSSYQTLDEVPDFQIDLANKINP